MTPQELYKLMADKVKNDPFACELAVASMEEDYKQAVAYVRLTAGQEPTKEVVTVLLSFLLSKPDQFFRINNPRHVAHALSIFIGMGMLYERLKHKDVH